MNSEYKLVFAKVKIGDVCAFNAYLALEPWLDGGVVCFNAV